MSNFEKISNRSRIYAVVASGAIALGGAHAVESDGATTQTKPDQQCLDAATAFPDHLSVQERQRVFLRNDSPPVFMGKISVSRVTDESGKICSDKNGERMAKFFLKINGEPVPQVVGFTGNRVEDSAKLWGFATRKDCKGEATVKAQGVYVTEVDLGNKTIKEKYLSPTKKANC